ncbi:ATP-binding protein [Azonexus sp.]|uniref:ATP-binding protein n=1 Tax=Azonexus sp. TaxID=1872668 RepID=UPI0035AE6F5B
MKWLEHLGFRQKIQLSFAALVLLVAANALVGIYTAVSITRQVSEQETLAAIIGDIMRLRDATERFSRQRARQAEAQALAALAELDRRIAATPERHAAYAVLLPLLDDYRQQFQQYSIEVDQRAALESRALQVGQRLPGALGDRRLRFASLSDRERFDNLLLRLLSLQWQERALQESSRAGEPPLLAELRADLEGLRSSVPGQDSEAQRHVYRILQDAGDYVGSFTAYLRIRASSETGEQRLAEIVGQLNAAALALSEQKRQSIERQTPTSIALMVLVFLGILLLAATLSARLSRSILLPINRLIGTTRQIAAGQLEARAAVDVDDEIGELARSFNRMTDSLRALQLGLEQRVDERTAQLAEANAALRDYQGHLEAMVDERTSELLTAKEAAEAASRAKTSFLANMSHELRTPMNGILGMIALALKQVAEPRPREQLDKARRSAERLLAILNDILDLSRIEADRLHLEQAPFRLAGVLDNIDILFAHRAAEKGLRLRIDLPPVLAAVSLLGDALRLGQILINLVGNAIKFSERGDVALRVSRRDGGDGLAELRFEVEDSGIGISSADQQRIFAAFEQADGSMTRKYGGSGLGLAICRQLVELMDGDIGVVSTPGQGSVFWFVVRLPEVAAAEPLPSAGPDTQENEAALRADFAGRRILLVDDEPISREVGEILLAGAGLQVDTAEDGEQALAFARQQSYDLILMDMQMPNRNGIDATRAIRAESLNRRTPILAMTANVFDSDREACLAAGMNDHLAKPLTPEALFAAVHRWLRAG